jgi:hypothetical protein
VGKSWSNKNIGRRIDFGALASISFDSGTYVRQYNKSSRWIADASIPESKGYTLTENFTGYTGFIGEPAQKPSAFSAGKNCYWVSEDRKRAITLTDIRYYQSIAGLPVPEHLWGGISGEGRAISIGERSVKTGNFNRLNHGLNVYVDYSTSCGVAYRKLSGGVKEVRLIAPRGGYFGGGGGSGTGSIVLITYTLQESGQDTFEIVAENEQVLIPNIPGFITAFDARFGTVDEAYIYYGTQEASPVIHAKYLTIDADGNINLSNTEEYFASDAYIVRTNDISYQTTHTFPLWGFKGRVFTSYRKYGDNAQHRVYYTSYRSVEPQTDLIGIVTTDSEGYFIRTVTHANGEPATYAIGSTRTLIVTVGTSGVGLGVVNYGIDCVVTGNASEEFTITGVSSHVVELVAGVAQHVMSFLPEDPATSTFAVTFAHPEKGVYIAAKKGVGSVFQTNGISQPIPEGVLSYEQTITGWNWFDGKLLMVGGKGFYDLSVKDGEVIPYRADALEVCTVTEKHPKLTPPA